MRLISWRPFCYSGSFTRGQLNFLASYLIFYLFAILYCRWNFFRDPGSFFFDPAEGYRPLYSLERVEQAKSFIKHLSSEPTSPRTPDNHEPHEDKELCVGMATVKRPSDQYVDIAMGSLLAGLAPAEREEIHVNLLFAHPNSSDHPFFEAPWVSAVADNVLTYEKLGYPPLPLERSVKEQKLVKKSLSDYKILLKYCLESTAAPWIAILEDDILAQEGWYRRTMQSLYKLRYRQKARGNRAWVYLRLFYTEKFMGWNSEEWPVYLSWSLFVASLPALCGFYLRRRLPSVRDTLSPTFLAIVSLFCMPAAIMLYFLAGRVSMQPLRPGIRPMNEFGCCSQALVFPREVIPRLIDRLGHTPLEPVDSTIETWADEEGLERWAVVPSAMQHIGKRTYKKHENSQPRDRFELGGARGLWSFGFELHGHGHGKSSHEFDIRATVDTLFQ